MVCITFLFLQIYSDSSTNSNSDFNTDSDTSSDTDTSTDLNTNSNSNSNHVGSVIVTGRPAPALPEKCPKSRKRHANSKLYKKNVAKLKRNFGSSYENVRGVTVPSRILGPPCNCTKKCRKIIGPEAMNIFNKFWDLSSYDKQNEYLFNCINVAKPKRTYPKKKKKFV